MINRVVLVGRLARDPELRTTNSGTSICSFTVGVDKRSKNPDEAPNWIPCVAFQNTADLMTKSLRKGSLVGIEGRLNQRTYDRKDGTKAYVLEVLCDSIQFLEPKSKNASLEEVVFESDVPAQENKNDTLELPEDDLPF